MCPKEELNIDDISEEAHKSHNGRDGRRKNWAGKGSS
jgi:hypothetical protein